MRLFLDVDGVLNAGGMHKPWADSLVHDIANGWMIQWSPGMTAALRARIIPDVELWWATTWRNDATMFIAPLMGFGNPAKVLHPNLDERALRPMEASIFWKMDAVQKLHRRDPQPFIHVDDEFGSDEPWSPVIEEYRAWARDNGGLVVGPNYRYGIEPKHVDLMRDHIAKHTEG